MANCPRLAKVVPAESTLTKTAADQHISNTKKLKHDSAEPAARQQSSEVMVTWDRAVLCRVCSALEDLSNL